MIDASKLAMMALGGTALGGRKRRVEETPATPGINPGMLPPLPPDAKPNLPGPADMPTVEGKRDTGKPVSGIQTPNWLAGGLEKVANMNFESDAPPVPVNNFQAVAPQQFQYQPIPMQTQMQPFAPVENPMVKKRMFEDQLRGWLGMR